MNDMGKCSIRQEDRSSPSSNLADSSKVGHRTATQKGPTNKSIGRNVSFRIRTKRMKPCRWIQEEEEKSNNDHRKAPFDDIGVFLDQFSSPLADLVKKELVPPSDLRLQIAIAMFQTTPQREARTQQTYDAIRYHNPQIGKGDICSSKIDHTLPLEEEVLSQLKRSKSGDMPTCIRKQVIGTELWHFWAKGYPLTTAAGHPAMITKQQAVIVLLKYFWPLPIEGGHWVPPRKYFMDLPTLTMFVREKISPVQINQHLKVQKYALARHKLETILRQFTLLVLPAARVVWAVFYHWLHIFAPVEALAYQALFPERTPYPNPEEFPFLESTHPVLGIYFVNASQGTPVDQFIDKRALAIEPDYIKLGSPQRKQFRNTHSGALTKQLKLDFHLSTVLEIERVLYLMEREQVSSPPCQPLTDALANFLTDYKDTFLRETM
jgi:hypothetical protein